jgi:hypothetical protein
MSPDASTAFITGGSEGVGTGLHDYATAADAAATGKVHWAKRYDGPASESDSPEAMVVAPTLPKPEPSVTSGAATR